MAGKTKGTFLRAVVQPVSEQTPKGLEDELAHRPSHPTDEQLSVAMQEAAA